MENPFFKKKSLGQNFLKDKNALGKMAEDVNPEDKVLEIGPGEGALTELLLSKGATVIAVEKDDRLISILRDKFKKFIESGKFILIHKDALDFDLKDMNLANGESYKLIANIPYYITGAIIRKFLEANIKPNLVRVLVQKEVAERAVARDGKESILSLSMQIYGTPKKICTVPRGAFSPIPNVDSAILEIRDINKTIDSAYEKRYFELVKEGFSSKRKKLSSNLRPVMENVDEVFLKLKISPNARAEEIPFETWKKLATE